jgi:hypothetical protein
VFAGEGNRDFQSWRLRVLARGGPASTNQDGISDPFSKEPALKVATDENSHGAPLR